MLSVNVLCLFLCLPFSFLEFVYVATCFSELSVSQIASVNFGSGELDPIDLDAVELGPLRSAPL